MALLTYATRKLLGLCVRCGMTPPTPPHVCCDACRADARDYYYTYKPPAPQRPIPPRHPKALTHWWVVGPDPHPVYRTPPWWHPVEEDV